jgi:transposase
MKLHTNARTCPKSRRLLVVRIESGGWSLAAAAAAAGVSERTAYRWLKRWREEGEQGLLDRSSRPHRSPSKLAARTVALIEKLRRLRMTAVQIAEVLGLALSTISLWLKRIGLGKRSRLEPPEPPNRYERRHPGDLVHVDIKQLGRISIKGAGHRMVGHRASQLRAGHQRRMTGFEYVHVMVDDHTRLAYAEVLQTLTAPDAVAFLRRAVAWFRQRGVAIRAVMTDNGSAYIAHAHRRRSPSSASATCAPGPTAHAPTARPSASSKPCSTSGPTSASTAAQPSAPRPYRSSSSATTTGAHTALSATSPPHRG